MIEIKQVCKKFSSYKALDDLNISVNKGSVYGLLGPNGAGKTTIIKHLVGVYRQDKGEVLVDQKPVWENEDIKKRMVYIADDTFFFSQYTILETAKFYSAIYPTWCWERYERLKKVFPIETNRRVTRLSKGMQKQVAFWMGICIKPDIMILDEPVDGLDPVMRRKVWNLLLQDVAERKMTVIVSSHNLRELEDVCDHVGIMYNGKIIVEKNLDDIKSDVHKIQIAFKEGVPKDFLSKQKILHRTENGSILLFIVRGDIEKILSEITKSNPVVLDVLPLTLEEIFIYELEGNGYEIGNILI